MNISIPRNFPRISHGRANPLTTHNHAGIAASGSIRAKGEVRSFDQAVAFLGGLEKKTIASNVVVHVVTGTPAAPESVAIRLYNTDIIVYFKDGTFEADNGGYNTRTTASRCSQFGPAGYFFCHRNKKLEANGRQTGRGIRLPVQRKMTA